MRIVVSGAGGTGKTTLINKVVGRLRGYTAIPDFIDCILEKEGFKSPKELDNSSAIKIRLEALRYKIGAERHLDKFISDKGVVDYLAYWMVWSMNNATEEQKRFFYDGVLNHLKNYERVVFLKFGRFSIEDNGIRNNDWHHQFRINCLIKGLYEEFGIRYEEYSFDLKDNADKIIRDLNIA